MSAINIEKGTKRKLEDTEMGCETIVDNTAPIKQIVQELVQRERYSKAYKFYHQLLAPRRSLFSLDLHYTISGHPLKFFNDNWDGDISKDFFEQFQYKCTMPKVITEMQNIDRPDPVTEFMKVKSDWHHGNMVLKKKACYVSARRNKVQKLNDEVMQCPKYIIELATRLENDPDPNFDATYNWYYAGSGNMQLVCVNWVDYLLHSEFSRVYLSRFFKDPITVEREILANFDCDNGNEILETICSSQNIVALRTKHKIFILKIVETDDKMYFEKLKQFESVTPFTGLSFDKHHTNILYTTTVDSKLTIVNIDRMTRRSVTLKHKSDSLLNNWNRVAGVARSSYMHIERNAITLYDKRTNSVSTSWTGLKKVVDIIHCNDITAAAHCEDSPSLYFTTDHLAFLMDTRASKKSCLKAVQRWTHSLRCAPTYISIGKAENNKEFITLSSQWCEDTCVISNYANSVVDCSEVSGVCLPYHPPSIMNVLREARLKMLCCDLHNPIDSRLVTSTTGQVVLDLGENFSILTQNSLGDIFVRTLYPHYMESFIEDDSVQSLHDWSQSFNIERDMFEVTAIKNVADVWKKFKRIPEGYDFGPKEFKDVFDEANIYEAFENEELIPELLDAWTNERNDETNVDSSSMILNLQYEDSDNDDD